MDFQDKTDVSLFFFLYPKNMQVGDMLIPQSKHMEWP